MALGGDGTEVGDVVGTEVGDVVGDVVGVLGACVVAEVGDRDGALVGSVERTIVPVAHIFLGTVVGSSWVPLWLHLLFWCFL